MRNLNGIFNRDGHAQAIKELMPIINQMAATAYDTDRLEESLELIIDPRPLTGKALGTMILADSFLELGRIARKRGYTYLAGFSACLGNSGCMFWAIPIKDPRRN
jgi:hypothetical protein